MEACDWAPDPEGELEDFAAPLSGASFFPRLSTPLADGCCGDPEFAILEVMMMDGAGEIDVGGSTIVASVEA